MDLNVISPGHAKAEEDHRRELCVAGRWLRDRGFVVATQGNVSVRLDAGRILVSPRFRSKGALNPQSIVVADLEGRQLVGEGDTSTEIGMHLLFYRLRPDVNAVCHAHPPVSCSFAASQMPLNKALLAEMVVALGAVPVAPFGMPGTPELADSLAPFVPHHDAILLANHGAVTCGADLLSAFYNMEMLEQYARVSLFTELLGKQSLLSASDVERLLAARKRYGVKLPRVPGILPIVTSGDGGYEEAPERVTMTRAELEALIEEALRNDRARR
ncbi:MAG: class II aldolase/adducin family protein [Candidatus Acidiferrales bacterium]